MRIYIETIGQAKKELGRVYRDFKSKVIDSDNAKTKVYILRAIIDASYKHEVEIRLEELEAKINAGSLS